MSYPHFDNKQKSSKSWDQKWVSDTSWEWDRKVGGVRQHIAIDGSLKRIIRGRDAACGCAVVLAELELESTIKETNLCAFAKALFGRLDWSLHPPHDTGICGDVKKDALGQRKNDAELWITIGNY